MDVSPRPYLTAELPGTGGDIKCELDDFEVEEVPLYEASGEGQHAYLWVQKRGVSGQHMLGAIARHFGVRKRDIGAAGIKDKHALTRQWVSLPFHEIDADDPAELVGSIDEGIEVLDATLHRNKLRTGHLAGNRFRVVLRHLEVPAEQALERAQAVIDVLAAVGVPNYYGLQRFGHDGETLRLGVGLLENDPEAKKSIGRNRFLKRLSVSAVQSELFNRVLAARVERGLLDTVLDGDVVQKTDTGGVFVVPGDEHAECQGRFDRGEIALTGPMYGSKMIAPERDAEVFESSIYAASGFDVSLFEHQTRLASGTRRRLLVDPGEVSVAIEARGDAPVLVVGFFLPSGSYATVLLREITKQTVVDDEAG